MVIVPAGLSPSIGWPEARFQILPEQSVMEEADGIVVPLADVPALQAAVVEDAAVELPVQAGVVVPPAVVVVVVPPPVSGLVPVEVLLVPVVVPPVPVPVAVVDVPPPVLPLVVPVSVVVEPVAQLGAEALTHIWPL